ncbi:Transposase IS4 [Popillia japonica]|uniref:Transposase IS4 n=1 Tax=Popillia japonica TaxID=7064 RepID=A0AAW1HWU8_POPJA
MTNPHYYDNDNLDTNDRFAKLRSLFDKMNQKCLENAPHVEQHSIDEAMVPYFGRHPGKQFIKGKLFGMGINCGLVQRFMDTLSDCNCTFFLTVSVGYKVPKYTCVFRGPG